MKGVAPKLTVIIPVYNRYESVVRAIHSIDYEGAEIIVVDDGSIPPVRKYIENNFGSSVKIIEKENGGVSSARNAAIPYIKGEYVCFFDSDDVCVPGRLCDLVELMDRNKDVRFTFHDISRFKKDKDQGSTVKLDKLHSDFYPGIKKLCNDSNLIDRDLRVHKLDSLSVFGNLVSGVAIFPSSVMVTSDLVGSVGLWDEGMKRCNDMDYFARCLLHTDAIYIDKVLTEMGVGEDNLSSDILKQYIYDEKVIRKLSGMPIGSNYKSELVRAGVKKCQVIGWHLKKHKKYEEALEYYSKSFYYGFNLKAALLVAYTWSVARLERFSQGSARN